MKAVKRARALMLALFLAGAHTAAPGLAQADSAAGGVDEDSCEAKPSSPRLHVDVDGVRSDQGWITVTLYPDDRSRFLVHGGKLGLIRAKARAGSTSVCLALPGPAHYAVVVYHDANADRKFNRVGLMANEGYGMSNNASTLFGIPSFKEMRFPAISADTTIHVKLRYPGK